jgi:hypothetical protein
MSNKKNEPVWASRFRDMVHSARRLARRQGMIDQAIKEHRKNADHVV